MSELGVEAELATALLDDFRQGYGLFFEPFPEVLGTLGWLRDRGIKPDGRSAIREFVVWVRLTVGTSVMMPRAMMLAWRAVHWARQSTTKQQWS